MKKVRVSNNQFSENYTALDSFMYAIYLMTVIGEPIALTISYRNTIVYVILYMVGTSLIVHFFDSKLLIYYLLYMPSYIVYTQIIIFVLERKSKIGFLQEKRIKSLLEEQSRIFDHMPDGLIMHQVKDIDDAKTG